MSLDTEIIKRSFGLPEVEVPVEMALDLEEMSVDDDVSALVSFKVIGKSENETKILVKSFIVKSTKRIQDA